MAKRYQRVERFTLFGKGGTIEDRKLLGAYLKARLDGHNVRQFEKQLNSTFGTHKQIIDDILEVPGIGELLLHHPILRDDVAKDILNFIERSRTLIFDNEPDVNLFSLYRPSFNKKKKQRSLPRWIMRLILLFNKTKLKLPGGKGRLLKKRIGDFQERFEDKLERFDQVKSTLGPFTDYANLWGAADGLWQKSGFNVLKHFERLMLKNKELQDLTAMLGKYRAEEFEQEQALLEQVIIKPFKETLPHRKEDVIGIHESDELSNLLPSEAALLANVDTEIIFYQKLVEKKLQTFEMVGDEEKEQDIIEETYTPISTPKDKGPIIICLDSSASMMGKAEALSKTICFAMLKLALAENRKCYLITYSKGFETIELSNIQSDLETLIRFLSMSFKGGTDSQQALNEAIHRMKEGDYEKADLLLISDGKIPTIPYATERNMEAMQNERQNKFFALTIAKAMNERLFKSFTAAWLYHPDKKNQFKEMVEDLKQLERKKPHFSK